MSQEKPFYKTFWFCVFFALLLTLLIYPLVKKDTKPLKDINTKSTATQTRDERKIELKKEQIESIKVLIEKDLLYIEYFKVYVAPFLWHGMDAQLKEDFAAALAIYCGNANDTTPFCEIYDKMSAKKIAKYDAWGFKVY